MKEFLLEMVALVIFILGELLDTLSLGNVVLPMALKGRLPCSSASSSSPFWEPTK